MVVGRAEEIAALESADRVRLTGCSPQTVVVA